MVKHKKLWQYVKPFSSNIGTSQTDRYTDGQTDKPTELLYQYRASVCWRAMKTRVMCRYPMVKKSLMICWAVPQNTGVWQTDVQTSCDSIVHAMHSIARKKWNDLIIPSLWKWPNSRAPGKRVVRCDEDSLLCCLCVCVRELGLRLIRRFFCPLLTRSVHFDKISCRQASLVYRRRYKTKK